MNTRFFVDANGVYQGGWAGSEPPVGLHEVPSAPDDIRQIWDFENKAWPPAPQIVPDAVTARQFKLQLVATNLIDVVDAWIATQDRSTQVAYEYSSTFVRNEPMMMSGFKALGFTQEQVNAFFVAASQL